MRELQLKHLIDLATADLPNAHDEVTQLYKWKFEHAVTAAKATAAAGASLAVALTVAILQAKVVASTKWVISGYVGAGVMIAAGVYQYYRIRSIYTQYAAAHSLLASVTKMRPFLERYAEEGAK